MTPSSNKVSTIEKNEVQSLETNWRSIYIAGLLCFSSAIQYSIYFGSMWPYLQTIDSTASESFFGFIVASYAISNILLCPLFGFWADKIGSIKKPLYIGLLGQLIGNAIYIFLVYLVSGAKYGLLVSRMLIGIGSSNVSLFKSYGATATTSADRARGMAIITSGFAVGICCAPAFNILFTRLGAEGIVLFGIPINMYTSPAIACTIVNAIGIVVIKFFFAEHYVSLSTNKDGSKCELPPYDKLAVAIIFMTRSTQIFIISNIETLMSSFSLVTFAFSYKDSINIISTATGAFGLCAALTYFVYIFFGLEKYIKYRLNIKIGLIGLALFHVITYSYPFGDKVVTYDSSKINETVNQGVIEGRGCDMNKFSWCESLNQTNPWVYFITFSVIVGICFPVINIAQNTLITKVIGPRNQGQLQGWMNASAGLSQFIGPILSSLIYFSYGPKYAWILNFSVCLVTLSLWYIFHDRLVPLKSNECEKTANVEVQIISKI
uniref:MFS domain-containing protein n=1 Tax=Rhabditophanes sp. KR3021 TaxID=114890 RepID=A0AC35UGY2_9BILA